MSAFTDAIGTGTAVFLGSGVATVLVQGFFTGRQTKREQRRARILEWRQGVNALNRYDLADQREDYDGSAPDLYELNWSEALNLKLKDWCLDYERVASKEVKDLVDNTPGQYDPHQRAVELVAAIKKDLAKLRAEWNV